MNELSDAENVGRYCARQRVAEDGRITGEAFKLWPKDKGYLSANWLEKISDDKAEQIKILRGYYRKKILKKGLEAKIKPGAKIACLNVGNTRNFVQKKTDDYRYLKFIEKGSDLDPSYTGIYGLTIDTDIVSELLAQCVNDSYDL